jgi:hypothetical protein
MKYILLFLGLLHISNAMTMKNKAQVLLRQEEDQNLEQNQEESNHEDIQEVQMTAFGVNAPPGADALLDFCSGDDLCVSMVLLAESGSFVLKNNRFNIIEIQNDGEIILGVSKVQLKTLQFYDDLLYQNKKQWKLYVQENYWRAPEGWDKNDITTCGGANLLGGYCILAGGENSKIFSGLPPHSKVRISAVFHFIDSWTGESAYLTANVGSEGKMAYLWTDRYDHTQAPNAIDICGASYGEGKFSSPIDVTVPHIEDSIKIAFGATIDQDACEESWGISSLSIYIM